MVIQPIISAVKLNFPDSNIGLSYFVTFQLFSVVFQTQLFFLRAENYTMRCKKETD